jgi:nitroreductase
MDLFEAMRCAPTTRTFEPDAIPRELLVRVLENARFAPSGRRADPWPRALARKEVSEFAFSERYGEPLT